MTVPTCPYDERMGFEGSLANANKHGKVRLKGKIAVIYDGDVVNFLFSV